MHLTRVALSGLLASVVFGAACNSGSLMNTASNPPGAQTASVSLTMGDTPPAGVAVISFEITVDKAMLEPGDVPLLSTSTQVEVKHLEIEKAFLSTAKVPAGQYTSIVVAFSSPELTIQNNSGSAIGNCANGAVCELKPTLTTPSVNFSGPPFPLTIGADSSSGLLLDFNLTNSLQSDLSVSPSISFSQVSGPQAGEQEGDGEGDDQEQEMEEVQSLVGPVTAVDPANSQFTLMDKATGQSLTINVDSNTEFSDFQEAGLTDAFSSLAAGQTVQVELSLMTGGSMLAKKVELLQAQNQAEGEIDGTIVTVDSATQFEMVVMQESEEDGEMSVGMPVTVMIASGAQFSVDTDGVILNSGLSFASASDLMVGQNVEVRRTSASSGTTIVSDQVRLRRSTLTATVNATNGTSFTVNSLSALFTGAGITEIQVTTTPQTEFEDVNGVGGLTQGDQVSLSGLLFKTSPDPTLVADAVRKREP